eukprot:m.59875 g.59875  ORF g.59875 m.59875 type:complete len:238 (-) comp19136_c0_seq2:59-772(-)
MEQAQCDLLDYLDHAHRQVCRENVMVIAAQVMRGLCFCHSNEIMHRDLKPRNILIFKNGCVKLADFGSCRGVGVPNLQCSPNVCSLWYRAPELLLGAKRYGSQVDIWSFGCVLYELATGAPLFPSQEEAAHLDLIWTVLGGAPSSKIPSSSWLFWQDIEMVYNAPSVRSKRFTCSSLSKQGQDLLRGCLTPCPSSRTTANMAMNSFFLVKAKRRLDECQGKRCLLKKERFPVPWGES